MTKHSVRDFAPWSESALPSGGWPFFVSFDTKSDQRDSRSVGSGQPLLRGCILALSADPFDVLCRLLAFPFSSVG